MKALTKTQLNYAEDRLNHAAARRKEEAQKLFPHLAVKRPEGLTLEQKLAMVDAGTAKRKHTEKTGYNTHITDFYDFPAPEGMAAWEAERTVAAAGLNAAHKATDDELQAVLDKLHLADAAEALAAINEFAAK